MLIQKLPTVALVALTGWALTSASDSRSFAQDDAAGGLEIAKLTGTLEAIVGNQLKILTEDQTPSVVLMVDNTSFRYTGTAEPSVLSPGLMVRFTAELDLAGTPQAPLDELEIFRPVRGQRLSLEVRQSQTPGIYEIADDDAAEAIAQPERTPPPAKRQPAKRGAAARPATSAPGATVQTYQVVGVVRAIQGDRMQVIAGNQPLIFQAAPEVKITVAAGDPTYCQPGDEVSINALKLPNGILQAESIHVTGTKPLGAIDPKTLSRNNRNNPRGKLDAKADKPKEKP